MNDYTDSTNISEFLDLKVPGEDDNSYEIEAFEKINYDDITDDNGDEQIIKSKIIKDQELSRSYLKTSIEKMFQLADILQSDIKKFDAPPIEYIEALSGTLKNISVACTNFSKINQQSMMAIQNNATKKSSNEPNNVNPGDINVQNNSIVFNGNLQDLLACISDADDKTGNNDKTIEMGHGEILNE